MDSNFLTVLEVGNWSAGVLANMVLGEGTLPYLQMETVSQCPHMAFTLCECSERGISSALSSSSKDTSLIGLVPHPFNLI